MDIQWLLAFTEGEGSFIIAITHNRNHFYLRPRFSISLHIDDKPLLEKVALLLSFHGIKSILQTDEPHGKQRSSQAILTVRGVNQCRWLYSLLNDLEWYSKKYKDFLIWGLCLDIFENVKSIGNKGPQRKWTDQLIYDVVYLRSFMNKTKRNPRSYRNEDEIMKWNLNIDSNLKQKLDKIIRG